MYLKHKDYLIIRERFKMQLSYIVAILRIIKMVLLHYNRKCALEIAVNMQFFGLYLGSLMCSSASVHSTCLPWLTNVVKEPILCSFTG